MELLNQYGFILISVTAVFGFFMAFGIGANDVANAMGTSVGSKTITVKQAILIAIVFEFAGAYLAGGEVTSTIKNGIIDPNLYKDSPHILVLAMMSALFAAGIWLLIASLMGWPVSTTHSIVGSIIGVALITVGSDAVQWTKLGGIVGSWFITPIIAGIIAFFIFMSIQKLIFDTKDPLANAKKYGPFYMGLTALIISVVTMLKGLKHIGLNLSIMETAVISISIAIFATVACAMYLRSESFNNRVQGSNFGNVEKVFSILMLLTACTMAFAHGSNDVSNAIGPVSAVVSIIDSQGAIDAKSPVSSEILLLGAIGIVTGLAFIGYRVMGTIGTGITDLTPSRGFAAEFACAITVVIASGTGLPISTTQTLVGAILGVGFARGIAALNLNVLRNIFASWLITLPAGALLAIIIYQIFKSILL